VLFSRVRASGLPPFCAMVPLNLAASVLLAGGALAGGAPFCCGAGSLLGGSFESPLVAGLVGAQVLVPGIGGWGLMLLSLRRVTPLTMATLQLLQTPIGAALGYALGTLAEPTPNALAAGAFVLAGAGLVVAGGARRGK
jgi:drug/metabolite transporter (DMT)-like permease